ncbi:hypothetical protein [Shewanella baltica]|uniref:hypothetical protein n=1 Tax=Shewanella baltica TaxID=62322 RepID=UPI000230D242|nr:hypothetical protein [Shewanella baltica]EHC05164.1 hypothetical protein Sbal625DRAFT_3297 [Shewanella baltica OS625]
MENKLNISSIWWRNVQPGEFYNIERYHQIKGGGGSLYIEIPSSMVPSTLDFLDAQISEIENLPVITIQVRVIGNSRQSGPIEFHRKTGGRMRIARQNRQQPNSQRHPAWVSANGFPVAPDTVTSTDEARQSFPNGGLRIYIAKTIEGHFYAGFTKGARPAHMQPDNPMWDLYGNGVGGVIEAN